MTTHLGYLESSAVGTGDDLNVTVKDKFPKRKIQVLIALFEGPDHGFTGFSDAAILKINIYLDLFIGHKLPFRFDESNKIRIVVIRKGLENNPKLIPSV